MLAHSVQTARVPLDLVKTLPLGPVADFRPGPALAGLRDQEEVCRLAQVVDYLPGQAAVYRQAQAAESLTVLVGAIHRLRRLVLNWPRPE